MIIQARSSLFFKTFSVCWAFVITLTIAVILARPNPAVSDRWRDNEVLIHRLLMISTTVTVVLGLAAVTLFVMEVAIRRGWEPAFLEVYRPGCTILEMERLQEGKSNVTVLHSTGETQVYEADASETPEVEVGSTSHLWVIGQYISRIQVIEHAPVIPKISLWSRVSLKPNTKPWLAGSLIVISTLLTGYATAYGLIVSLGGSLVIPQSSWPDGRPDADLYEGTDIHLIGLTLLILGVAGFLFTAYSWYRGWDESVFENLEGNTGPDWS